MKVMDMVVVELQMKMMEVVTLYMKKMEMVLLHMKKLKEMVEMNIKIMNMGAVKTVMIMVVK